MLLELSMRWVLGINSPEGRIKMEKVGKAGKKFLNRQRKALVMVFTVGAMIALPYVIGTPTPWSDGW